MRMIFGVLGLLFVVAIVGVLARKQLSAGVAPAAAPMPAVQGASVAVPAGTPQQQIDQFKQAAEAALAQPRTVPEDK